MIVTFEEVLSKKEWLHSELLNSLTGEMIQKAAADGFYDIKLLVNGEELEPEFFNKIMNNVEKYIIKQAKSYLVEKLEESSQKIRKLEELYTQAANKISEEFDLDYNSDND